MAEPNGKPSWIRNEFAWALDGSLCAMLNSSMCEGHGYVPEGWRVDDVCMLPNVNPPNMWILICAQ